MFLSKLRDVPGQLLVRGNFPKAPLAKEVPKDALQAVLKLLDVEKLRLLQDMVLFGVYSDLDIFMIGAEGVGKTTAYLVPILMHLFETATKKSVAVGSPLVLINCHSTERAIYLESLLQKIEFLQGPDKKSRIALLDNVENMGNVSSQECLVVIMTGSFLSCAMHPKSQPTISKANIDFNRVAFIVFEELGMHQYFYSTEVVQLLKYLIEFENLDRKNFQLIFSGSLWGPQIDRIHHQLTRESVSRKNVLLFPSIFQALHYSRVTWDVRHCVNEEGSCTKINELVGILHVLIQEGRISVVACRTAETALHVSRYLAQKAGIQNNLKVWNKDSMQQGVFSQYTGCIDMVYVASDDSMEMLDVKDVSVLINFDIDSDSLGKEPINSQRYACIWNKLGKRTFADGENGLNPLVYLLVTGDEANFLPIFNFLHKIRIQVPLSVKHLAKQKQKEFAESQPLCSILKCFGFCSKLDCPLRHVITAEDLGTEPDCPADGEIECKIIKCETPSLYLVRLTKHFIFDENDERKCVKVFREELNSRMSILKEYYDSSQHRVRPMKIEIGERFCIGCTSKSPHSNERVYLRVKITKLIYSNKNQGSQILDSVEVLSLDTGVTIQVPKENLMILPEPFKSWEPHCVQLVLTNLLPPFDSSNEYFAETIKATKILSEGKIWQGKVLLSLRDTVWVNPMVMIERNPVTGMVQIGCNLRAELVFREHATVLNHHMHMGIMLEHIRKFDPKYPEICHELTVPILGCDGDFYELGDYIQWRSIDVPNREKDMMRMSPVQIKIHSWIDPWEIYGALMSEFEENSVNQVILLELKLTQEIEQNMMPRCKSDFYVMATSAHILKPGLAVAVRGDKDIGFRWQRGIILEQVEEEDVCRKFNVFLVDYGIIKFGKYEVDQVLPILKKFVDEIPFQAVCLQMAHITPVNGECWTDENIQELSRLLTINSSVNVIAYGKVVDTSHPCKYYQGFILQQPDDSNLTKVNDCIGLQLVKQNEAQITPKFQNLISRFENFPSLMEGRGNQTKEKNEDELTDKKYSNDDSSSSDGGDLDSDSEDSEEMWERFQDDNSEDELPGPSIKELLNEELEKSESQRNSLSEEDSTSETLSSSSSDQSSEDQTDINGEIDSDQNAVYFDAMSEYESDESDDDEDLPPESIIKKITYGIKKWFENAKIKFKN